MKWKEQREKADAAGQNYIFSTFHPKNKWLTRMKANDQIKTANGPFESDLGWNKFVELRTDTDPCTHTQAEPLTMVSARWNWFDWPLTARSLPPAGVIGSLTSGTTRRLRELGLSYRNLSGLLSHRNSQWSKSIQSRDLPLWHPCRYLMLSWIWSWIFITCFLILLMDSRVKECSTGCSLLQT